MEVIPNGLTLESAVHHAEEVPIHDQGHVTIPNQLMVAKTAVNLDRLQNLRLAIPIHALVCISFYLTYLRSSGLAKTVTILLACSKLRNCDTSLASCNIS